MRAFGSESPSPVFLIDAMNYIFRAYYGMPATITAPSGMKTNAVLGYLRTLLRIIREENPPYMAAAFEGAHSFRRKLFADYKANRGAPPDDLKVQFAYCRQLTEAIGIRALEVETFEADDVIGSIAIRMADKGHPVVIVSGDKDLAQLVDDRIRIYDLARNLWLDEAGVRRKLGVDPKQVPDLLALLGDAADNIPGIPGVAAAITSAPAISRGARCSPRKTPPSTIGVSGMMRVTSVALVVPARCSTVKWHSDASAEPNSPMPMMAPIALRDGSGRLQG
jgi:5'-3' exonuclease